MTSGSHPAQRDVGRAKTSQERSRQERSRQERILSLHEALRSCSRCPKMIGPVVHGPPVFSGIFLLGQAPGPHEGAIGHPFAWTAGKTLFRWFDSRLGVSEELFRKNVYMSAVARCFPGKAKGGGDRKPDAQEIAACRPWIEGEVELLEPALVLLVGGLAIEQVLGHKGRLVEVVGKPIRTQWMGREVDVICLPHPSGASSWHRTQPGIELLDQALALLGDHSVWQRAFPGAKPLDRSRSTGS